MAFESLQAPPRGDAIGKQEAGACYDLSMDFSLGPELEQIRHEARRLVLPFDDEYWREHDEKHEFPWDFYNAFAGEMIPWIATGHRFNDDYTEVTIDIRPGVKWSDGRPWTARDLVFTINMLRANAPDLSYSTDMDNWVAEAVAEDSLTARIRLTAPV